VKRVGDWVGKNRFYMVEGIGAVLCWVGLKFSLVWMGNVECERMIYGRRLNTRERVSMWFLI